MAKRLPTEMAMACEQVVEVSGEYLLSICGKPLACPEAWFTSGMPPEEWLSVVCYPLKDRSLDDHIYMLGNVPVEGCGKMMMMKVSGLVYAAKIVDIMNREPIQFEPENYDEIRGLLAKSSSVTVLPTIFNSRY